MNVLVWMRLALHIECLPDNFHCQINTLWHFVYTYYYTLRLRTAHTCVTCLCNGKKKWFYTITLLSPPSLYIIELVSVFSTRYQFSIVHRVSTHFCRWCFEKTKKLKMLFLSFLSLNVRVTLETNRLDGRHIATVIDHSPEMRKWNYIGRRFNVQLVASSCNRSWTAFNQRPPILRSYFHIFNVLHRKTTHSPKTKNDLTILLFCG